MHVPTFSTQFPESDRIELLGALGILAGHGYKGSAAALQRLLDQAQEKQEAAAELDALRNVYEQARGVLRHDGIDKERAIQYRDGLVEAIETVKVIDGGNWEPPAVAQVPHGSYVSTSGELKPDVSVYDTPTADATAASAAVVGSVPCTFMTADQARDWAWNKVREDVGTEGWTVMDSVNYYGFFLWGWNYRAQYELQHTATRSAVLQEILSGVSPGLQQAAPVALTEPVPTPCRSMFASQREYADAMEQHRKNWAEVEAERALLATGGQAQAVDIAELVTGMSVSVDVSTCDDDAGNRYFGTVTVAQEDPHDKHGLTLLVQDAKPNFTPQAQADARDAESDYQRGYRHGYNQRYAEVQRALL